MFQNQQFNANSLPVPFNGIDQSTLNPNLPNANDRIPQIQLSQWMNANQQIGLLAIGLFRSMAQNSINKSGTHVAGYNLLSQNQFQNQLWNQYCQMTVDLVEFLILVKRYQPNDAIQKGAQRSFEAFLGMVFHTYPELQNANVTPNGLWPGLQTAMQIHQTVVTDIRNFRAGGYNNPQQQGAYNTGGAQLPPINLHGSYQAPAVNSIQNFQTNGYTPNPGHTPSYSSGGSPTNSVDSAFYDDPAPVKPLMPVEEISRETLDYYGNPLPQETKPMQTFNQPQVNQQQYVEPEVSDLPVPMNVDQVVIDPTYYAPQGVKLDLKRPYDYVYSPGGIVSRPGHQVDWEVTIGDDMPWKQLVDPGRFCLFLVQFPDGVVKEKFVEWNPSMEYLRHELDAEMQRKAYRPNGIVVPAATPISTVGGDAAKEDEVFTLVKDGHLKRSAVPPVILSQTFMGTTDMEVELMVREELQNLMGVEWSKDIPMPATEYRSTALHPLTVSKECFDQLTMLTKQEELGQVALGLRELTNQGILPLRYFRFINDRLTAAVNDVLRDGMVLKLDITNFCEDYIELEAYISEKKGQAMVTVLKGAAETILTKAMYLMEADGVTEGEVVYHIADNYINFQLGWTLDDLATLNIRDGKAVLISASAHKTILETLKGMIGRANANEEFVAGTMRLITSDGYYLEVIRGRLIQKAVLLKLIK